MFSPTDNDSFEILGKYASVQLLLWHMTNGLQLIIMDCAAWLKQMTKLSLPKAKRVPNL